MFGTANYAASKAGLFGLTKTVTKEVARFAITVNCLAFGYFRTGMFLPQNIQQDIIDGIPLGRPGELVEATGPLLFLLSDRADYITGQIIHVNGGWYT
jgi:3-oxoacyl-[acyl-carrier protein] reductase